MTVRVSTASLFIGAKVPGTLLLLKSRKFGKWMVPGGHIEDGEAPGEAAVREALEETGLDVKLVAPEPDLRLVDGETTQLACPRFVLENEIRDGAGNLLRTHVDFIFFGRAASTLLSISDREFENGRWCTCDDIDLLDMFENSRRIATYFFDIESTWPAIM